MLVLLPLFIIFPVLLASAPQRLPGNTGGTLYVNTSCISCGTCARFAPRTFSYDQEGRSGKYVVREQPDPFDPAALDEARAAITACPVAAIRTEKLTEGVDTDRQHRAVRAALLVPEGPPFPRPVPRCVDPAAGRAGAYHLGHHHAGSFGATPYLVVAPDGGTVMVDTPRPGDPSARAIESLTGGGGPDYLFMTHVDDTAGHGYWAKRYPKMKRIFHRADAFGPANWIGDDTLGDVEILLGEDADIDGAVTVGTSGLRAWNLDGTPSSGKDDVWTIIHTPGHSPGSVSLLFRPEGLPPAIFTGDTLAYSERLGALTGFPAYNGGSLGEQARTLEAILELPWAVLLPGHQGMRSYSGINGKGEVGGELDRTREVKEAMQGLLEYL